MEHHTNSCVKIGEKAPDFTATTTFGPRCLSDYKGKWLILFSHPGDFTPVCTTEFIAFAKKFPEFTKLNTELLGLSIDSNASHLAWVYDIYKQTGIQIPFPVIADRNGSIAMKYGMLSANTELFATVRNTFIIDPEGKICAILIYPYTNGRCIAEILRLLEALQISYKEKVVTPACWQPGEPTIIPPPQTYKELMERTKENTELNCVSWYLCYKE